MRTTMKSSHLYVLSILILIIGAMTPALAEDPAAQPKNAEHDKHDDQKAHGHEETNRITLTARQMSEFAIATRTAKGGSLDVHIVRPAEIKFNGDRIVHVIPRVDGTVKSVFGSEGQHIKKDDLPAVLDSRELADAKAEYLAGLARLELAKENLDRDQRLSNRKIVS